MLGKTNQQIADELFISGGTVKNHIHNLLKKLGANSRVDAILIVQNKLDE